MTHLVLLGLGNLIVAAPLALVAWLSGRFLRRPAITHGLWVLVLLKLVTPPLGILPITSLDPAPRSGLPSPGPNGPGIEAVIPQPAIEYATTTSAPLDPPALVEVAPIAHVPVAAAAVAPSIEIPWQLLFPIAGGLWLTGAVACWLRSATKCVRFQRLLKGATPADAALAARVARLADELNVAAPKTVLTSGVISPLLWVWCRRATLVLPRDLFEHLPTTQQTTLLVHELAHWKRGDHWVRRLECLAGGLYWWCPLVWLALAGIRQAEEEMCDAWVVATVPDSARDYALALVETVDFLAGCPTHAPLALPPLASGLGPFPSLQRRLTMIFRSGTPRRLTLAGFAGLVALGGLLLTWTPAPSGAQPPDDNPRKKKDFGPRGDEKRGDEKRGGDERGQIEELQRKIEQLKARLAEAEKGGRPGDGDKDRLEDLQKTREKLRARVAELEKALGGQDPEKIREKALERLQDFRRGGGPGGGGPAPEDLQRMQKELEQRRTEIEKMQRELQRKAEELRQLGEKLGEEGRKFGEKFGDENKFRFEFKFRPGDPRGNPQGKGDQPNPRPDPRGEPRPDPRPDARPDPKPEPRGDARPNPNRPRGDQGGPGGGDLERRMDDLERKLDMILREMRGGQGGPGGFPWMRRGGPGPNDGPPPRRDNKDNKDKGNVEIELIVRPDANGNAIGERSIRNDRYAPIPVLPQRVDPPRDQD